MDLRPDNRNGSRPVPSGWCLAVGVLSLAAGVAFYFLMRPPSTVTFVTVETSLYGHFRNLDFPFEDQVPDLLHATGFAFLLVFFCNRFGFEPGRYLLVLWFSEVAVEILLDQQVAQAMQGLFCAVTGVGCGVKIVAPATFDLLDVGAFTFGILFAYVFDELSKNRIIIKPKKGH